MVKKNSFHIFYFLIIFGLMGCTVNDMLRGMDRKFLGAWQSVQGPGVITFYHDYRYGIDLDGDAAKDAWGRYNVFMDQISLQAEGGMIGEKCHLPGIYRYSVKGFLKGQELSFNLMGDQCLERIATLGVPWKRYKKTK